MKLLSARQRGRLLVAVSMTVLLPLLYVILSGALGGKARPSEPNAEQIVPGLPGTVFISATGKRILGVDLGALTAASLTSILHEFYGARARSVC